MKPGDLVCWKIVYQKRDPKTNTVYPQVYTASEAFGIIVTKRAEDTWDVMSNGEIIKGVCHKELEVINECEDRRFVSSVN